jgi:hypothetical protein
MSGAHPEDPGLRVEHGVAIPGSCAPVGSDLDASLPRREVEKEEPYDSEAGGNCVKDED